MKLLKEGFCGENFAPLCNQDPYATGAYYDSTVVNPTTEDTASYCAPNP